LGSVGCVGVGSVGVGGVVGVGSVGVGIIYSIFQTVNNFNFFHL
jgi:hypothetical protein